MELLDVSLTGLQRRNRAVFVPGSVVRGGRWLKPGEKVVLRDEVGDYFAGTVVDHDWQDGALRYLLHLGVRLPEEYAMLRLGRPRPSAPDRSQDVAGMQSLLDMLGEVREAVTGYPVPAQRLPR